ncbi:expansin-YoaJ-like [Liolophura sinensis]|uniref:expansin-YoaJ-like n=1 Tax=Liolophura sinensis TaxID=3198878 RepID=UPI0031597AA0
MLILGLIFCCMILPTQQVVNRDILSIYKKTFHGDGTFYGEGGGLKGLCQYYPPGLPPAGRSSLIRNTVALNKPQMHGSLGCGMCFKVKGSGKGAGNTPITGDFYVFVDNLCPECLEGSLDFGQDGDGRWAIEVQAVQCPVGNTKIQYSFQGSHQWYIKLQIRNHRIPITGLRLYQSKRQEWTPLKHTADGYWELDPTHEWDKPLVAPLKVQLVAANGVVLKDSIPKIENGVAIQGNVQVPYDPHLPNTE